VDDGGRPEGRSAPIGIPYITRARVSDAKGAGGVSRNHGER
jgi:hypothetical protein